MGRARRPSLRSALLVGLSLLLLGLTLYANTFQVGFYFDGAFVIYENSAIRNLGNLKAIWEVFNTRFITGLTFAFNYALGRLDPFGYHLFNILCHIASAFLVSVLVGLTFETSSMRTSSLQRHRLQIAFFSSLLFLVHPIQIQAVTYLAQRSTSLATFFYLASVVLYVRSRLTPHLAYYLGALLTTLLGMFTKEISFTIPFALLLYEFIFLRPHHGEIRRRLLLASPFLLMLAVIPLTLTQATSHTHQSAYEPARDVASYFTYPITQLNVIRTYLRLLFLPIHQNLDYDYPISQTLFEPSTVFSLVLLSRIAWVSFETLGRQKLLFFCIGWFFLTLSVESSFIPLRDLLVEQRLYLPIVGFSIFVPTGLFLLCRDAKKAVAVLTVLTLILSVATYRRNAIWKDELTLWQDVVKKSPNKARGYSHVGLAYIRRGEYGQAIEYFRKAVFLVPDFAGFYDRLGAAYGMAGEHDKALFYCRKALRLDPGYPEAYANLGAAYGRKGAYAKALKCYRKALRLNPDHLWACEALAAIYALTGNREGLRREAGRLRALHREDLAGGLERLGVSKRP